MSFAANPPTPPLLKVKNLKVSFRTETNTAEAVKDFSFDLYAGETLALVGESGSGKSVCALCLTGLLESAVIEGSVSYLGKKVDYSDKKALRALRGGEIAYIFQEPSVSLNPLQTIEKQITERLTAVSNVDKAKAREKALEFLEVTGIKNPLKRLKDLPHSFSGGERQRVMIAMALTGSPKLLVADEPTTALDAPVQRQILDLLTELKNRFNMSTLLITHDLNIVRDYADRVVVVKDGKVEEEGVKAEVFENPKSFYTKSLLNLPDFKEKKRAESEKILAVANLSVRYNDSFEAVKEASFTLSKGESLGIVGASGSGKSSLMKAVLRLIPSRGEVFFKEKDLLKLSPVSLRSVRRHIQAVFQDPYGSLNPRMTVSMIVSEGLLAHGEKDKHKARELAAGVLEETGIGREALDRYPHEFSGGQRQRIAIARALILKPDIIFFDEPTSSLDRAVQFQILELLKKLQEVHTLSYVFITHDLRLVEFMCHRTLKMEEGRLYCRLKSELRSS